MITRRLRFCQVVPRDRDRVFPFFEKAENLALITPRWLGFQVLTPTRVRMAEGCIIDYRIRLFGLPVHWRSLVSHYEPPLAFVDEQLSGPYGRWRHLHRFEAVSGGTRLIDEVEYQLPLWLPQTAAALIDRIRVRPRVEEIFACRRAVFTDMFGGVPEPLHGTRAISDPEAQPCG
ncbi:MAG: SRPBCC family protein [Chromatiaceae bacterium]